MTFDESTRKQNSWSSLLQLGRRLLSPSFLLSKAQVAQRFVWTHPKWAALAVGVVAAGLFAEADGPSGTSDSKRFSAEAITLLGQTTQAYDLDGRRMPSGSMDPGELARLAKCDEELVSSVASTFPQLKLLHELATQGDFLIAKAIEKQAEQMPLLMAEAIINHASIPDDERDEIRDAARTIEAIAGTEPQLAVNRAWSISCMQIGLSCVTKNQLRKLASQKGAGDAEDRAKVEVTLGTGALLGAINVTNRSPTAWHNCLIITTLDADRTQLAATAVQEELVGAYLLPGLGFSQATVEGSQLACRLRTCFNLQEKGVVVFVGEVPAGSTVTTLLADPQYYRIANWAGVSLWADELAVERQQARNWDTVKAAITASMR